MIDIEALLSAFLRDQPDLQALVGDRVYTDLPHQRVYPLVVFTRTAGGYLTGPPYWLESAAIVLSAYGGTHKQAHTIATTCLSLMTQGLRGSYPQGAITGLKDIDLAYDPDVDTSDDTGHSRPRYLLSLKLTAHP